MPSPPDRYRDAQSFRMALENRLKGGASTPGRLTRLRKQVAFERFLARLVEVGEGWVLKGAFALDVRYGDKTRTTQDLDLAMQSAEQQGTEMLRAATEVQLPDYFSFQIRQRSVRGSRATNEVGSYVATALVAGRTFESFSIDLSYNETPLAEPDTFQTFGHIEFAGIEPVSIPVVPIEQHLAEKISAYVQIHNGRRSSRPKDLVDIVLIADEGFEVDAETVINAVQHTLHRNDRAIPAALPTPPQDWATRYTSLAAETGVTTDLSTAYALATEFLNPILAKQASGNWNPSTRSWEDRSE